MTQQEEKLHCYRCHRVDGQFWKCCERHTTEQGPDVLCPACANLLHQNDPDFRIGEQGNKNMEFENFVRKPFVVEAIEVTTDNIEELSGLIGSFRKKDNGLPYIQVDRRLVPNVYRVYPGFYMTRMGDNIRCYSKRIFLEQFTESTPQIEDWVNFLNDKSKKKESVA